MSCVVRCGFLFLTVMFSSMLCLSAKNEADRYASSSVLSNGNWMKFSIEKDGIYKITFAELKKMGYDDPEKVSIHGYGGNILSEDFTEPYIDDLPALRLYRTDDCILFYACGARQWNYNPSTRGFEHVNNPYSDCGYYFISDLGMSGNMDTEKTLNGTAMQITTFDDYILHERDLVSVNKSGRDLFGEGIHVTPVKLSIGAVDGITNEEGRIEFRAISRIMNRNIITLSVNDVQVSGNVPGLETDSEKSYQQYVKAKPVVASSRWAGEKSGKINMQVSCSEKNNSSSYLDWIRLQFKRELKMYSDSCMLFRSISSLNNKSEFRVSGANNVLIFDITDHLSPKIMETKSNGDNTSFIIPASDRLREFAVIKKDRGVKAISSKDVVFIDNQNLHGYSSMDMVIISPKTFKSEAQRLLDAHKEHNDIESGIVVTPEEIYNEFSSGTPDATAYRRFMKMLYDRGLSNNESTPKYLLLFGDGSYDNRFATTGWKGLKKQKDNFLLTYQTTESLNMYSYVTDDYYGMLDDEDDVFRLDTIRSNNRLIDVRPISQATLKIGIGRLPVRTLPQAAKMVDKVIYYMENNILGSWKNSLTFIADDGSNSDKFSTVHQYDANNIADLVEDKWPEYTINKIFFDAYKREASNSTYPDVEKEIKRRLNEGSLILNYTGHGNSESLSDEHVITHNNILQYKYSCLPVWITATCEFCRFDDIPTSAGEDVFLNANSGGIALFTTLRVAFTDINADINRYITSNLLDSKKGYKLGDVIRETKNSAINSSKNGRRLGFALIGDPALKLNYPKYKVNITSINDQQLSGDTLKFGVMDEITIEGELTDINGNPVSDFEGVLNTKIFEAKDTVVTLGNNVFNNNIKYTRYSGLLHVGNNEIKNGKFKFSFVVPKDISYASGNELGKMSFYAYDIQGNEAKGFYNKFKVVGDADVEQTDNESPEIRELYLNDSTFVEGDKVNSTPMFFARLWDKSGINITGSGIGHDIILRIDNNPYITYVLNSYYDNVLNKEGEGIVKFSIPELEPGLHEAEFKVWDVMNNSTTYTFQFEVEMGLKPYIADLYATPSPAKEQVTFHLTHNRPGSNMRVGIMVYDLTGKLQWSHEESGSSEMFKDYTITWDLTNNMGAKLRTGIYIYRAAISTDNSKEATDAKKIILLY